MALGFVVGFWSVCGPLLWNKQWRIRYFQFLDHKSYKLKGLVLLYSTCCIERNRKLRCIGRPSDEGGCLMMSQELAPNQVAPVVMSCYEMKAWT
ncbi:hypothetical protein CFP56_029253 [Quercus suber]|uniref:Uncharacterized protein n=1 Tax=Quercus suber TaxID=58331 RepID=A0AAW0MB39_QUESU